MMKKLSFYAVLLCLSAVYSFSLYADDPVDTDNDGLPDFWEIYHNLNYTVFDSGNDTDSDSLTNLNEYIYHTNPNLADTDNDGLLDGEEVNNISPEFNIYSNPVEGVYNVRAAYNGTNYFVYWDNDSGVYAKILDNNANTIKDTFKVNTFYIRQLSTTEVTTDGDNFFAVWGDDNIFGQLFSSTGEKIGDQIEINETEDYQNASKVVFNGQYYCVTWYGYDPLIVGWDPDAYRFKINYDHWILARIIDNDGNTVGDEILVYSTYDPDGESKEDLYIDVLASQGNFMIVYQLDRYGDDECFAAIIDDSGDTIMAPFQINTISAGSQLMANSCCNGDTFFLSWISNDQDGDAKGIFGKIYDSSGNEVAADFQINSYIVGDQDNPLIIANGSQYFVTWVSELHDGDCDGVFGQIIDSDGTKIGSEFMVNTSTAGYQNNQWVAANGTNYLACWKSVDDGIYGQAFDLFANKQGAEILIKSYLSGTQGVPFIVSNQSEYLVMWTNGIDVSARTIHLGYGTVPSDADSDDDKVKDGYEILCSATDPFNADTDNDGLTDYEELSGMDPQIILSQDSSYLNTDPDIAYNGMNHLVVWKSKSQDGTTYQIKGRIVNDYGLTHHDEFVIGLNEGMNELESSFESPSGSYLDLNNPSFGNYVKQACRFVAADTYPCRNIELKLQKKGSPSGNVFISLCTDGGYSPGNEILQSQSIPASSVSSAGEWVQFSFSQSQAITTGTVYWVVLQSDYPAGANCVGWEWNNTPAGKNWSYFNGIGWANYASYTVGALYRVYSSLSVDLPENQMIPSAASDGQNYIVVWQSLNIDQTDSVYGIYGRIIGPAGEFLGSEFQINSSTTNLQLNPVVASDGTTYCVLWDFYDNDDVNVNYQYLNLDGSKNGTEVIFAENFENPVVCSNGTDYIVRYDAQDDTTVKSADISTNSSTFLYLKEEKSSEDTTKGSFVNADNQVVAPDLMFSYPLTSLWRNPCSAYYEQQYLVAWQDNSDTNGLDIYFHFVDDQGVLAGNLFRLNSGLTGDQSNPVVSANESGYLLGWQSDIQGQNGKDIIVTYVKSGIGTDPLNSDTDNDGVTDQVEVVTYGSDPVNTDTDNDGLSDGQEVNNHNTSPVNADTDNDGVGDGLEVNQLGINPLNPDSDSDGMSDGDEILAGMDPSDPLSVFALTEIIYDETGAGVKLTWTATSEPNRSYRIFWKNLSESSIWTEIIDPEIIDNSNGTNSFIDTSSVSSSQRVYKVIVEYSGN